MLSLSSGPQGNVISSTRPGSSASSARMLDFFPQDWRFPMPWFLSERLFSVQPEKGDLGTVPRKSPHDKHRRDANLGRPPPPALKKKAADANPPRLLRDQKEVRGEVTPESRLERATGRVLKECLIFFAAETRPEQVWGQCRKHCPFLLPFFSFSPLSYATSLITALSRPHNHMPLVL